MKDRDTLIRLSDTNIQRASMITGVRTYVAGADRHIIQISLGHNSYNEIHFEDPVLCRAEYRRITDEWVAATTEAVAAGRN